MTQKGLIVVADSKNHRIQVFNSQGQFICKFGSKRQGDDQFDFIGKVAIDFQERILITDTNLNRVQIFKPIKRK